MYWNAAIVSWYIFWYKNNVLNMQKFKQNYVPHAAEFQGSTN